jgi:SAM-dependent methyltransferase
MPSPETDSVEMILSGNRAAYDKLAVEYSRRVPSDLLKDLPLVYRVWTHLMTTCACRPSIIDLGCGHGVNLAMFDRLGAQTTGLDFSPQMIQVGRTTSPSSHFIEGDFLSTTLSTQFHLVFAKAFLHLFPLQLCHAVLVKMRQLLLPHGLIYIATTTSECTTEGWLPKADYPDAPKRFRRLWREDDLLDLLGNNEFEVVDRWYNEERDRGKEWINIMMRTKDAK